MVLWAGKAPTVVGHIDRYIDDLLEDPTTKRLI